MLSQYAKLRKDTTRQRCVLHLKQTGYCELAPCCGSHGVDCCEGCPNKGKCSLRCKWLPSDRK